MAYGRRRQKQVENTARRSSRPIMASKSAVTRAIMPSTDDDSSPRNRRGEDVILNAARPRLPANLRLPTACSATCIGPKTREGARLLGEIVEQLHARAVVNRRSCSIVVEATLNQELFDRLCMWQWQCQDCEMIEAVEGDEDQDMADT